MVIVVIVPSARGQREWQPWQVGQRGGSRRVAGRIEFGVLSSVTEGVEKAEW